MQYCWQNGEKYQHDQEGTDFYIKNYHDYSERNGMRIHVNV